MRLSKFLFFVLIIATFAACSSLFSNDSDGPELRMQTSQAEDQTTTFNGDTLIFKPIERGEEPREYPPFTSQVNNQQIVINGYYLAASGFTPESTFDQNDKTITIHIHAAKDDNVAPSISEGYFYDAYLSNLPTETYTVKVVHKHDLMRDRENNEHTVFTKEFVIE
jgi:hypothetical protein